VSLFVVRHQHAAEACPAKDARLGAMLLNHLSRPNVRRHGIDIKGEAVIRGEHTLYMIVDASDSERVLDFMQPFVTAGTVDVLAASTCTGVVAAGGCESLLSSAEEVAPSWDAEDACQDAIEAGLVVHRAHPLNCETSIAALIGGVVMPNAHFYVRNHFQIPRINPAQWRLVVGGHVQRRLSLSLRDLMAMRSHSAVVTLECAGNGRSLLDPATGGEPWKFGAVSTAEWTGVPLDEVLDRAGLGVGARAVLFRGADGGTVDGSQRTICFERSLSIDEARESQALLAYAMNGESLPIQHGYPLRLVVPGWYAVASVKWLTDIEVIDTAFDGYYQRDRYIYEWCIGDDVTTEPVTLQRVRSLITEPQEGTSVDCGDVRIRGVAWSGAAAIAHVEVSVDGRTWQDAQLQGRRQPHSWQWWELTAHIEQPREVTLRARATDLAGRTQPHTPQWNRLGYGSNGIHIVVVHAR
jgi:DMSO/TMAO reductase YedYZ molybdopterin-dependent catalytic subunit